VSFSVGLIALGFSFWEFLKFRWKAAIEEAEREEEMDRWIEAEKERQKRVYFIVSRRRVDLREVQVGLDGSALTDEEPFRLLEIRQRLREETTASFTHRESK
jgi:hypothetical protein